MATAPKDRLNKLFSNESLPSPPKLGQPHFSEKELAQKKEQDEQSWKMPSITQYPQTIQSTQEPTRTVELMTSSDDDDDYVAAFRQKPSMKVLKKSNTKPKPRVLPEPNALGYLKDARIESKGPIEYIPKGKASSTSKTDRDELEDSESDDGRLPTSKPCGIPVTGHFCQFDLVAKFPYKYMNDSNDRVSRHFFANNKFYNRTWDIYYVDPPYTLSAKPVLLVPHEQALELITEIGEAFKIPVSVPSFPFTLTFYGDGTPQPKFLGKSRSRSEAGELQRSILPCPIDHGECPEDAPSEVKRHYEDFRSKCVEALAASKKKSGIAKKRGGEDQLFPPRDSYSQLKRGQRYLGLRPKSGHPQPVDPNLSWDEQEIFFRDQQKKAHLVLDPLDLDRPAPHHFEKEPIFLAIDVESYERAHHLITEIGVSTLDALDIANITPGPGGENWMDQIRSRHFRIKGREHLVNKDFCLGNPDHFQFGKSEFVAIGEAAAKLDGCFEWPFSVQYKHPGLRDHWGAEKTQPGHAEVDLQETCDASGRLCNGPTNTEQHAANSAAIASVLEGVGNQPAIQHALDLARSNETDPKTLQLGSTDRHIVLIGHDIRSDLDYLKNLGSKIFSSSRAPYPASAEEPSKGQKILASILEVMDTASLYRTIKEEAQIRKLTSILEELGRLCYFPHNAGNDARYTLEAFVAMMVKARLDVDEAQKKDDEKAKQHTQAAADDSWN